MDGSEGKVYHLTEKGERYTETVRSDLRWYLLYYVSHLRLPRSSLVDYIQTAMGIPRGEISRGLYALEREGYIEAY